MPQKTIKLTIEYVGTNYCGWQFQPNGVSIQEVLENRLERITGRKVTVYGSGRTDSGVHAEGQVAHFKTEAALEAPLFQRALNSLLPEDIVIRESVEAPAGFHAQRSSKGKRYRYTILNRRYPSAFLRPFAWFLPYDLDIGRMWEAALHLAGTHDFASFQAAKSSAQSTVRDISSLDIVRDGDTILFFFEGSGFLKHMVRIMVGTLVDFGCGRKRPEEMKEIIEARDRKKAGRTAPPHGLCLEKVFY